MRLPWQAVAGGALALAVGVAGLVLASIPTSSAQPSSTASEPIVVSGAYVRAPVPPTQIAAAYFTVTNTTSTPDRLTSVQTGAGATAVLHAMTASGGMAAMNGGVVIPAHGRLVLTTGGDHVMIEHLFGRVLPGQNVNIELQFQDAGEIDVAAPVIAVGTPAPTDSTSGAHT